MELTNKILEILNNCISEDGKVDLVKFKHLINKL